MFSDQEVFMWDFESLEEIKKNPTPKNLLQASSIIRRLLMDDGTPLIHKVAGPLGYKPRFKFVSMNIKNRPIFDENLSFYYQNPSIYGENYSKQPVKLDQFLSSHVVYCQGSEISVGDFIRYCANVAGGVHKGEPKGKFNSKNIHTTSNFVFINGNKYPLEIIRNIIDILLKSLQPIYGIIKA